MAALPPPPLPGDEAPEEVLLRLHHGLETRRKLYEPGALWAQLRTQGLGEGEEEDVLRAQMVRKMLGGLYTFAPPELGLAVSRDSLLRMIALIKSGGRVPIIDAVRILHASSVLLSKERTVGRVEGDAIVVGDIHGQIGDLLYIIDTFGLPGTEIPSTKRARKYIFNGDYVDRGNNGCEVFLLVMLLKICFPKDVHVNRGNHETEAMNLLYGFYDECISKYGHYVYTLFRTAFEWLPLCSVIGQPHNVFVVHGGLYGVNRVTVSEIDAVPRGPNAVHKLRPRQQLIVKHSLWSDPGAQKGTHPSPRGEGVLWGEDATKDFLKHNPPLKRVVRSHQFPGPGVGWLHHHSAKVLTVFSASNYAASEYDAQNTNNDNNNSAGSTDNAAPARAGGGKNPATPLHRLELDSGKPAPMGGRRGSTEAAAATAAAAVPTTTTPDGIHPRMRATNRGSVFLFEEAAAGTAAATPPPPPTTPAADGSPQALKIFTPAECVRCRPQWSVNALEAAKAGGDGGDAGAGMTAPAGGDVAAATTSGMNDLAGERAPPPAMYQAPAKQRVALDAAAVQLPPTAAYTSSQRFRGGRRDGRNGSADNDTAAAAAASASPSMAAGAGAAPASVLSVFTWSTPLLAQDNPRNCVINPHTRQAFQYTVPYGAHCKGRGVDPVSRVVNHIRNSCVLYASQLAAYWDARVENPAAKGTPQAVVSARSWMDGIASVVNIPQCKVIAPYLESSLKNRGFLTPQNTVRYRAYLQQALQLCNARPAPVWHAELLSHALARGVQMRVVVAADGVAAAAAVTAPWGHARRGVAVEDADASRVASLRAVNALVPVGFVPDAGVVAAAAAAQESRVPYLLAEGYRRITAAAATPTTTTTVKVKENDAAHLILHHIPEVPAAISRVVAGSLRGGAGARVKLASSLFPAAPEVLEWVYSPPLATRVGDEDTIRLARLYQHLLAAYKRPTDAPVRAELLRGLHHLTGCAATPRQLHKVLREAEARRAAAAATSAPAAKL